ncbi:bifunctional N(6)-L-threonylcarbamoyladenine synthase/serine/threonine protein kinase [Candidatus Micrarchaeota archaeon]|nr:bifunctional N(6)-L-threonylcarbamoyladenine synthase/serine/threonine protein kinase [Candidatus Micrarchaeota archaeon]
MSKKGNELICLGIEATAHSFGIGIVDEECSILANEKNVYTSIDAGIHPREAADLHYANAKNVLERALEKAGIGWKEIGLIAFSQGPGLGPCLRVGVVAARSLSLIHNLPLLGVNHCVAHIEIGKKLCNCRDPIIVYASGANTQIIGYESGRYRIYGETLDIGIGNLLDVFGRAIGLGFPAGPVIDEMYFKAKNYIELPYTVKGMDLAFSGLLTAAKQKAGKVGKEDLAFSLMHNAFAMLTEVSERAIAHTEKKELLLTGGVAASKALREMMEKMCKARKAEFNVCPREAATDNGAMIAWLGIVEFRAGRRMKVEETVINQKFRTDQVRVNWIK